MLAHLDDAFASLPHNPDAFARHLGRAQLRWEQENARTEPDARTWALVRTLVLARHARLLDLYPAFARWVTDPESPSPLDGEGASESS